MEYTDQIEILYINSKNQKKCNEWYSLINIREELTTDQQKRLDELNKIFDGKAFIFSDKPVSKNMEDEAIRNEIIQAFGMVINYHNVNDSERVFFHKRFKYMFDILKTIPK